MNEQLKHNDSDGEPIFDNRNEETSISSRVIGKTGDGQEVIEFTLKAPVYGLRRIVGSKDETRQEPS